MNKPNKDQLKSIIANIDSVRLESVHVTELSSFNGALIVNYDLINEGKVRHKAKHFSPGYFS